MLITSQKQLAKAPYYVLSNDTFMSYWGQSEHKINTVVLPCANIDQALLVVKYAESRSDQNRIRIVSGKPKLNNRTHTYSYHTRADYSRWYPGGKVQHVRWDNESIVIRRETGYRKYNRTNARINRLLVILSPAFRRMSSWGEHVSFEPVID